MRIPRVENTRIGQYGLRPQGASVPMDFNPGAAFAPLRQIGNQVADIATQQRAVFEQEERKKESLNAILNFQERWTNTRRELKNLNLRGKEYQQQGELFLDSHLTELQQERLRYNREGLKQILFAAVERRGAQAVLDDLDRYPLEPTQRIEFLPEKSLSAPYVDRLIKKTSENYQRIPD